MQSVLLMGPVLAAPYRWDPVVDTAVTAGAGATWAILYFGVEPTLSPSGAVTWKPGGIDHLALGRWSPGIDTGSDVAVYSLVPISIAASAYGGARHGDALTPALLVVEAWSVTGLVVDVLKVAVDRPRPYHWIADPPDDVEASLKEADSMLSFPSGHTAFAAALSFSTATVLADTADVPLWAAYGGAAAVTGAVGAMRVLAGQHYPTDVLAGAVIGAGIGVSVPAVHRAGRSSGVAVGVAQREADARAGSSRGAPLLTVQGTF